MATDYLAVRFDNYLIHFLIHYTRFCLARGLPIIFENSRSIHLWIYPIIESLLYSCIIIFYINNVYILGTSWKKPIGILPWMCAWCLRELWSSLKFCQVSIPSSRRKLQSSISLNSARLLEMRMVTNGLYNLVLNSGRL